MLLACHHSPLTAQSPSPLQDSLYRLLRLQKNDSNKVNLLNNLAKSYRQSSDDSVWKLASRAKQLAEQIAYNKGLATALINISIYHRTRGEFTAAIQECLRATQLYEEMKAGTSLADSYLQLAQIYKDMSGSNNTEDYLDRAIAYSNQAYGIYETLRDSIGLANSLNQAGICYRDKGKQYGRKHFYDTAFAAYLKALKLVQHGRSPGMLSKLYNNISQVYSEHKKDYHHALSYLLKAEKLNLEHQNLSSLSYNYGNIAFAYSKLNNHAQSLLYARKMLAAGRQLKRPERIRNAYTQLYNSHLEAGRSDSALFYYILADKLDDSLTNLSKMQQVLDLQTKYETDKKESTIVQLQEESSNKNKRIAWLLAGLVLVAALAACMLWLYQRVRKQSRQIAEQSARLEVMMKELHHRVKNNLQIVSSLLSLQSNRLTDEGAISVLRESQLRVQAMSFIHQRLYKTDTLTAVNMKEYLTDLAESLVSSYGYNREAFDLEIIVEKELMDIDKALPTGLIINEMVTNSLKYAYQSVSRPSLSIQLRELPDEMILVVKDNGVGMDVVRWQQSSSSFGKQLISALCKQLRAKQSLQVEGGTEFRIVIPFAA